MRRIKRQLIRKKRIGWTVIVLALFCALTFGSVASATEGYANEWRLISAGGENTSAGSYTLQGSIGQAVAGQDSTADNALCAGYWCFGKAYAVKLFMPIMEKN